MTTDEARAAIRAGAYFGDVYEQIGPADGADLAAWFVREPGLPNLAARVVATPPATDPEKPLAEISGRPKRDPIRRVRDERIHDEPCHKCGCQRFIQTGACKTCCECGESGGCV